MCPACLTAATYWLVGGVSGGGVATMALCKWREKVAIAKTNTAKEQTQVCASLPDSLQSGDKK